MKDIGDAGEITAQDFIKQKYNWKLLDRNWSGNRGEIDIIYLDKANMAIHFIEVKQRKSSVDNALAALTKDKAQRLRLTAQEWIQEHGRTNYSYQFDVVAISQDTIDFRQNVLT